MDENDLYLKCSCHGHLMTIEKEPDSRTPMWYVAYWKRGYGIGAMSLRNRLRHAWIILTKGTPYTDELVFERQQMIELKTYIDKQLEKSIPSDTYDK
jgi:hypothetical protein